MDSSIFSVDDESDDYALQRKSKPSASLNAVKKTTQSLKAKPAPPKRQKPDSDDDDSLIDDSGFSHTPPSAKKQKKARPQKSGAVPLAEVENDSMIVGAVSKTKAAKSATQTYQKLTQLEHIIKRPDTYIGSVEKTEQQMWVFNKSTLQMEYRNITYVPGFYKIFDEILVNAADNKQRDGSMTHMKVNIDRQTGEISVENNGKGIPVVVHEKEKIYIPELIFGHLLAGSNFDDEEQKTVGGRNGYGAKLCNVFSTEFVLECQDSGQGKRYKQTWTQNMQKIHKAKITSSKTADFVRVTFKPDYDRFGMPEGISDDLEALLYRRVYDMAGTVRGVKVFLNGDQIKLKDFKSYCDLYAKSIASERTSEKGTAATCTVETDKDKGHPRWEVGFTVSDGTFQQVSFVNCIATTSGGTHVNYIADQITSSLLKTLNKRQKGHSLKQNHLRNHIFIFVNCLVNNPAFTSQTKEQLTTKPSHFGSKCTLGEDFLKKISKSEALEHIMDFAQKKADKLMSKSDGGRRSRVSNAKLVEANLAGTKRGHECTLILTEGDSAKGLAVSGRNILDPDRIGAFPLRGKLLNVRDASVDQITKNQEIQNIKQFLGLKHKQVYTDTKSLRYGHLMIMADQDHDGSHIKGLLINFLQVQFPSLLRIPDFFREFITPIIKVWQGSNPKKPLRLKSFFTQPQYEEWKEVHKADLSRWESKYYKGLGSSTSEDAQVYFKNLDEHLKEFQVMQPAEADLFDLAFSKKKADARKEWLGNFVPGTYLDHSTKQITYGDFINRELILFSMADNMRSIPSVLDGFKPGQRKVLYACFKRNAIKDRKVVELAGYVSEQTAYHHGEASLQQTIIGLAQDFVGSNNVNCLEPSGNFGSRLKGGSDAASPRYIFTRLSAFARRVFPVMDEPVLKHVYDDDEPIEPVVYAPVIPMVLVNGADGIGTGWSTSIPNYHPIDIVNNLKRRMGRLEDKDDEEKPFETMVPWFRGWKGKSEPAGPERYRFNGIARQSEDNPNEVIITELPIRMWTDDFKARLESIISGADGPSWIKDYKEFNDHKAVYFEIMVDEKFMGKVLEEGLLERFKLTKQVATSNLVAFNSRGQIHKYENVQEILEEYYHHRLSIYTARKEHWLGVYHTEFRRLSNQARFIKEIIDGDLVVSRKRKDVLIRELRERKYEPFPRPTAKKNAVKDKVDDENEEDEAADAGSRDYDYLLSMPIWSLTAERLEKLKTAIERKKVEYDKLLAQSEKDMWFSDLDAFVVEWENQLALDAEIQTSIHCMGRRVSKKIGAGRSRRGRDDEDYEPEKKGRAKSKATDKPETKSSQRFADMFSAKPKTKKEPAAEASEVSDNFSDDDFAALSRNKPTARGSQAHPGLQSQSQSQSKRQVHTLSQSQSQPNDADTVVEAAQRSKRAAASKAKTLLEVSSASEGDDDEMLGDIGAMVKGIGKPKGESTARLSLYAMNRPHSNLGNGGSSALPRLKTKTSKSFDVDSSDDTNYEMLAMSSPHKTIVKGDEIVDNLLPGDDAIGAMKPSMATTKPSLSLSAAASKADSEMATGKKGRGRPAGPQTKTKAELKAQKAAATATTVPPAAKVTYAAKRGARKKAVVSDESESDDIMVAPTSPVQKPVARGRPARAAAAKRPVIVDEDSTMMLEDNDEGDDIFDIDDDED